MKNARRYSTLAALFMAACALPIMSSAPATAAAPVTAIRVGMLHVGNGKVIDGAVIIIKDGRIAAVGDKITVPDGASIIEVPAGAVTPGLIDANSRIEPRDLIPTSHNLASSQRRSARQIITELFGLDRQAENENPINGTVADADKLRGLTSPPRPGEFVGPAGDQHDDEPDPDDVHGHEEDIGCPVCGSNEKPGPGGLASGVQSTLTTEQSSETVPHTRALDMIDLSSPDFTRLSRGGVTTVYVSPDATAVIGPRGAIVKTAGPLNRRVLQQTAAVKATIGTEPYRSGSYNRRPYRSMISMYTRRPTTRMGVTWVFRKAFYDTIARSQGLPVGGADTPSVEATDVLRQVLAGKIPLRVQARTLMDITSAVRLCNEFTVPFTLEEGSEAYKCIDLLEKVGCPVILGPIEEQPTGIRGRVYENTKTRYFTMRKLLEAGIPTALSAQDLREEDGLARQAMYAMRFGVSFQQVLSAVTSTPARLLGLDKQLGTIEKGKQADLVIWSGTPFAATSRPLVVLVGGAVVLDRR